MAADPSIGVDLKLTDGDLTCTNTGDLALVGDIDPAENIWQAVSLRLITALGTYLFAKNYGTRVKQYIDEPITDDLVRKIKTEVNSTILQDSRVKAIANLKIDLSTLDAINISFGIITINGGSRYGTVLIGG